MSEYNSREFDHINDMNPGDIKESAGRIIGSESLHIKGETQFSKADFMRNMNVIDEIEDFGDGYPEKVNDRIDRNKKQINLAYWANVNNMSNSQLSLHAQESLPEIYSIKKIYMIIVVGRISIQLSDQKERIYSPGSVIDIPSRTKMKIKNVSSDKKAILVMKQ